MWLTCGSCIYPAQQSLDFFTPLSLYDLGEVTRLPILFEAGVAGHLSHHFPKKKVVRLSFMV